LDGVLSYLEPADIQALSCTCRTYREELMFFLDFHRHRLKRWSTLTEAEARACIEMSTFFIDEVTPSSPLLTYIASQIRQYKIDLKTAEHVLRYDVFPILWSAALFAPLDGFYPREWLLQCIDERRQRSQFWQRLTAPYETLVWNCTLWHFQPLWDKVLVKLDVLAALEEEEEEEELAK
jgi:hypothetical protein